MEENADHVAVVSVHYGLDDFTGVSEDPFHASNPADNKARLGFYSIDGFPVVMIDGLLDAWPLTTLQECCDERMLVPCSLSVSVRASNGSDESSGTLFITLESETGLNLDARLNVMVIESGVPGSGEYEDQPFSYGLHDNLCSPYGQIIEFGEMPESIEIPVEYLIDPTWDWYRLDLVAFVQDPSTGEVLNACMTRMSDPVEYRLSTTAYQPSACLKDWIPDRRLLSGPQEGKRDEDLLLAEAVGADSVFREAHREARQGA